MCFGKEAPSKIKHDISYSFTVWGIPNVPHETGKFSVTMSQDTLEVHF